MHYFIEHHHLPEQNSVDTFGPEHSSPQDIFKITSEFQLTQESKAFACQAGIAFVQPSTLDPSLVNLILKPMYGLRIPQDSIQYYVYRGLLQSSFLSGTDLVAPGSTNSELMAQVWADWEQYKNNTNQPNLPAPTAADIGFEDTLADALLIEALYNYSQDGIRGTFVPEGTWLGNFGSSQKIGFEIITQKENLTLDLGYLRSGKHQIDITGLSGLALRKKREEVLSFIDPAALFGMHCELGVQTATYDAQGNKSSQHYQGQTLYAQLLDNKFATRNRVYLDIRSELGLSYNFYQNYGDTAGNNLKLGNSQTIATAQKYESQSWPLLMLEDALETASDNNDLKLNLRVDDNTNPLLYLENTALLGTNHRARFLADSQLLDTGAWTQDINLQFPNVAGTGSSKLNMPYYIKLAYGRQDFNPVAPKSVPHSEAYFNNAFCPINLPNLGNVNAPFQRLQNPTKHFLKGQIAGADFAYVAENGAYWDNDRILFYAQASHSYQSTGKFYSSAGIEHKLSLESQSFQSSFLNKNLNINCQLYEEEVSTGQYESFKAIALGHYTGVPNFQENLLLLGITLSELEDLRLAADAVLSAEHPRYLFLEEETDSPKIDKEGRAFQKFILKIQGLKPNGEQTSVASIIPTALYSRDGFCFTSKEFAEKEDVIIIKELAPVQWLGSGINVDNKYEFKDYNNNLIQYDNSNLLLPAGLKVIELNPHPDRPSDIHIITWYKKQYWEGYIDKTILETELNENPYATEMFINDAEHTLHRANKKIQEFEPYNSASGLELIQVENLFNSIKTKIEEYHQGTLNINNNILENIKQEYEGLFGKENTFRVDRLETIVEAVYSVFNPPNTNSISHKSTTLVVPLSIQWFNEIKKQPESYYDLYWTNDDILNRLIGGSGEGDDNFPGSIVKLQNALIALKTELENNTDNYNNPLDTSEYSWLLSLEYLDFDMLERFIMIHNKTWNYDNTQKYAVKIALEDSFGPLRGNPLMTVLIHEMNVNTTEFLLEDTHIPPEQTEVVWKDAKIRLFQQEIVNSAEKLDYLFQANSLLSLVNLAYFFTRI